jgi:hypothetical protein
MLQSTEQAIVDILKADVLLSSQLRISAFPDAPPDDAADVRGDALCFVRFAGIDFDRPAGHNRSGSFAQLGVIQFEVHFLIRSLRDHRGAYGLMEITNELLAGILLEPEAPYSFALPGLLPRSFNLVGKIKNSSVWHWVQLFEADVIYEKEYSP